jgi:hypothetical protein
VAGNKQFDTTRTTIDAEKLADRALGSTEGRIASRLTAEAEQLIAREGPLYDEMIKNVQLPILEGAGVMARENAEALRKQMQKGGAASDNARVQMMQMRAQHDINVKRGQDLAKNRHTIDLWARKNARTQLEFNQNWAANLGGIRETYQSSMDRASELMLDSAIPRMESSIKGYAAYRNAAKAENRQKASRWITGALGVASLAMGGLGAAGYAPALLGSTGASIIGGINEGGYGGSMVSGGLNLLTSSMG